MDTVSQTEEHLRPQETLIHSDRGYQYTSNSFGIYNRSTQVDSKHVSSWEMY